ncbi:hypothetical protein [Blautia wexlerae]|uniref:hypothetical protein n=1 Tax=Blautia wexlerae TaxID=418240 RepID=UPI0034A2FE50
MRLIDADKLIQEMRKWYWDKEKQKAAKNDVSPMDLFTHLAITTIQEQPTAFDVDEVVQQLEMLIEDKVSESGDDWYTAQCLNEAVEIVKGGGIK